MVNVNLRLSENIFDDTYNYNIKYIGKSFKNDLGGHQAGMQETYYYFISHGDLYEVSEVTNNEMTARYGAINCNITISQVDEFTIPADYRTFLVKLDENDNGMLQTILDVNKMNSIVEKADDAYGKNGFYIFAREQRVGHHFFGGIVDIYDYDECSMVEFMDKINTAVEKTRNGETIRGTNDREIIDTDR